MQCSHGGDLSALLRFFSPRHGPREDIYTQRGNLLHAHSESISGEWKASKLLALFASSRLNVDSQKLGRCFISCFKNLFSSRWTQRSFDTGTSQMRWILFLSGTWNCSRAMQHMWASTAQSLLGLTLAFFSRGFWNDDRWELLARPFPWRSLITLKCEF